MKTIKLALVILICLNTNLFSQHKEAIIKDGTQINLQRNPDTDNSQLKDVPEDIKILEENIIAARNSGNISETERLNSELNNKRGTVQSNGVKVPVSNIKYGDEITDNLNTTTISKVSDVDMLFNQFTTVTEQVGPTKGRIWAIYEWKEVGAAPGDSMHCTFKYSDNGGSIWNHFITFNFMSSYAATGNQMDAEFLFNSSTNQKKMFVVFPIEGSFNMGNMALLSCDIGTSNPVPVLNKYAWTVDNNHTYHSPRVCSDNVNYLTVPYLYFCAAEIYSVNHNIIQAAVCTNPFSANPTLNMNTSGFTDINVSIINDEYDICYYKNVSDSIILVTRSQADPTKLLTYRSNIFNMSSWPAFLTGSIALYSTNFYEPKVASDGSKNIMIVSSFLFNGINDDVMSFSSTNGVFGPYTAVSIAQSTITEQYAEICAKYYSNGSFYCSILKGTGTHQSMLYRSSLHNTWNNFYELQNDSLPNTPAYDTRPGFRFVDGDSCFAVFSSDQKLCASAGCNSGGSYSFTKNLQLKLFVEGLYDRNIDKMTTQDSITVYLRNISAPYNIVDSAKSVADQNGIGNFIFANISNNVKYYLVIKNWNILETWSKTGGESFVNNQLNYDFTTSRTQAYGSNEKQVDLSPAACGIYSGDITRDGNIDLSDLIIINNDASLFKTGYISTDLNGDNFTNLTDMIIAFNNSQNFVHTIRP